MIRSILIAAVLGILAGVPAVYVLNAPAPRRLAAARIGADSTASEAAIQAEAWPICSSMGSLAESADWAALDPDFPAGKQAIGAGDWNEAIKVLTSAALRDENLGYAHRRPWILEPSATDLCEPDLHVFAKLFEDRLERGLEAQAFSGREIGGDDDVLDFFVGHLVDVDLARQPAA